MSMPPVKSRCAHAVQVTRMKWLKLCCSSRLTTAVYKTGEALLLDGGHANWLRQVYNAN